LRKITILLFLSIFFSCGKDGNDLSNGDNINPAYSAEISGSLAKGAFITGSTLTFYELNDNLSQTGKSYNTNIVNDFGSFDLSVEEITENYARVVGDGFYWNELTNETTEEKLSLNSISEVKENINVNILTHIEYDRVINLVKNESKSFDEAKTIALSELLSAFGLAPPSDYEKSEEYNFKDGNQASNILLTISAVIQASRTVAEVTSLITKLANDLKDNGDIDDNELKTDIATELYKINFTDVVSNVVNKYKEVNPNLSISSFDNNFFENIFQSFQGYLNDQDNDGVQDEIDQCSDTPEGSEVDQNGCSQEQRTYQVEIIIDGDGYIEILDEEYFHYFKKEYDYGASLELEAIAAFGWEFFEWSGDVESLENPYVLNVISDTVINAVFKPKEYELNIMVNGEGTVSVSPDQQSYAFDTEIEITAIPSQGWTFTGWELSDVNNSIQNPITYKISDNNNIAANFSDEFPTNKPNEPTQNESDVISVFGDFYQPGVSFDFFEGSTAIFSEITLNENSLIFLDELGYCVFQVNVENNDFSSVKFIQFDYWTPDFDKIAVELNQWGQGYILDRFEINTDKKEWKRVTIEIPEDNINRLNSNFDIVFLGGNINQGVNGKLFLDNIFFY
jgi:hypothetical protein